MSRTSSLNLPSSTESIFAKHGASSNKELDRLLSMPSDITQLLRNEKSSILGAHPFIQDMGDSVVTFTQTE
eukprot:scaffold649830_cov52-Prasinocladus_malaysianus.AAC.1